MKTQETDKSYKEIVKSTSLFGFVQVFNILVKIGINKAVAVILGTSGMGIIGLFQSTISILQTGFDLGLSQSIVRDISEAKNTSVAALSKIISISKKIIFVVSLIGAVLTIIISSWLSEWTFGNTNYTYAFVWLSVVVFLNILSGGQLAILKGVRMLRVLAKASLFGSVVGLFTSVPLYFFLKEEGIVPSLIVASVSSFVYSWYYVGKVDYDKQTILLNDAFREGKPMLKMGIALMYVSFLGVVGDYIVRAYISRTSSIEVVGIFQAGATVITNYFGVVFTALSTDYYPRISAINKDNVKLSEEFNRQSEVSLLIVGPLVVVFLYAMTFFVKVLYTDAFLQVVDYLEYAVLGNLLIVVSNALGMILLAKQATNIFYVTATFGRIVILSAMLLLFNYYGLRGLGIATFFTGIFHLLFMQAVLWKIYKIRIEKSLFKILLVVSCLCGTAFFIRRVFENSWIGYILGAILIVITVWYSLYIGKKMMNMDFFQMIKQKIKR